MYRTLMRAFSVLGLSCALLNSVPMAAADSGRPFAASYHLGKPVEAGGQVEVTMRLTLQNPNNTDIHGGIVAVYNSQPNPVFLGSFSAIKSLPHLGQVTVTQTFTLPAAEYARWQHGRDPQMELLMPAGGGAVEAAIQAHRVIEAGEDIQQ